MEQARKRSLTASEKVAERTLIMLRTLGFIPVQSYDYVIWDPIKRVAFQKSGDDLISEKRERSVVFEWEYGGPKVTLVLRHELQYILSLAGEYSDLSDSKKGFWWTAESIEVVSVKDVWSLAEGKQTKTIGKIMFNNQVAISMMEDAVRLHRAG